MRNKYYPFINLNFTIKNGFYLLLFLNCIFFSNHLFSQPIKVEIKKTDEGFILQRNGQEYYVIGAGGQTNLDLVVELGGNSIRTWGLENAQEVLDQAHSKGLSVMLGFWVQHERHGFDYDNDEKVKKQIAHFKRAIDQFKNHPALLMWGIGNEVDLFYTNPKVWNSIQEIAKYAHEVDPNHPTSTVTAGLDSLEVKHILARCPDIDIYCVNTYGDIANVPQNIQKYGWNKPYMITEWGPNGHWESPVTGWNAAIEQTSKEKADVYQFRYSEYIEKNKNHCLGSYVFLWGQKQEYTTTWYGLFSKEGYQTEAIDALKLAWSKTSPNTPTPTINSFKLDGKKSSESLHLMSNSKNHFAEINTNLKCYDLKNCNLNKVRVTWKILSESTDKKAGGDVENEAEEVSVTWKKQTNNGVYFDAPSTEGAYRLFVTIIYENKVAYANFPFYVDLDPARGNGRNLWIKKWEMKSFDEKE